MGCSASGPAGPNRGYVAALHTPQLDAQTQKQRDRVAHHCLLEGETILWTGGPRRLLVEYTTMGVGGRVLVNKLLAQMGRITVVYCVTNMRVFYASVSDLLPGKIIDSWGLARPVLSLGYDEMPGLRVEAERHIVFAEEGQGVAVVEPEVANRRTSLDIAYVRAACGDGFFDLEPQQAQAALEAIDSAQPAAAAAGYYRQLLPLSMKHLDREENAAYEQRLNLTRQMAADAGYTPMRQAQAAVICVSRQSPTVPPQLPPPSQLPIGMPLSLIHEATVVAMILTMNDQARDGALGTFKTEVERARAAPPVAQASVPVAEPVEVPMGMPMAEALDD